MHLAAIHYNLQRKFQRFSFCCAIVSIKSSNVPLKLGQYDVNIIPECFIEEKKSHRLPAAADYSEFTEAKRDHRFPKNPILSSLFKT